MSAASVNSIMSEENKSQCWYQDCAATQHMTSHTNWMKNYTKLSTPVMVMIGDATKLKGIGIGDIELQAFDGQTWYDVVLESVLHIPQMPFNLFSVSKMLDKGYIQTADSEGSIFKTADGSKNIVMAKRDGNLYKMCFRKIKSESCFAAMSIKTWHERLAHQNIKYVRDILNKNQIKFIDDWDNFVCIGCVYGKQHRVPHPINSKVQSNILDLIHIDLCEMDTRSLGGSKYFLVFKDDFSHFRTVYFLKTKDEAASKLDIFTKLIENQFDKKIKSLRTDKRTEIKNGKTKKITKELGIFHTLSNAYTPQQNGRRR